MVTDLVTLEDGGLEAEDIGGEIEVAVSTNGFPELHLVEVGENFLEGVSEETIPNQGHHGTEFVISLD